MRGRQRSAFYQEGVLEQVGYIRGKPSAGTGLRRGIRKKGLMGERRGQSIMVTTGGKGPKICA